MRSIALVCAVLCASAAAQEARVLDDFEDLSPWTVFTSDQVTAALRPMDGQQAKALCLDYDLRGVSGYAAMRRTLPLEFPPDYEFRFAVRGSGPVNRFEFKLVDERGENGWWVAKPWHAFPGEWTPVVYKKRHIEPAWGSLPDKTLQKTQFVEFRVHANAGGRGSMCVDELRMAERAPPPAIWPEPVANASSGEGFERITTGATPWRTPATGEQTLTLDFGARREFGGLVLDWMPNQAATAYEVELSDDGEHWHRVLSVAQGNGGTDWLRLGESQSRWLRLVLRVGEGERYGLRRLDVRLVAFGETANAFFEAIALREGAAPFPRGFSGQQPYWTVVGIDGGRDSGLLSEDGALEVARGGFSMQPFVLDATGCDAASPQLSGWPDVAITQSLADGYLPMPQVHWKRTASGCDGAGAWSLDIEAFGAGTRDESRLIATYVLRNDGPAERTFNLALAVQPFQVNPPVPFLTASGGVSPIHRLEVTGGTVSIDDQPRVFTLEKPALAFATPFEAGMAAWHLARGAVPSAQSANDATGFASGAWLYPLTLAPGKSGSIAIEVPLADAGHVDLDAASVRRLRADVAAGWHEALDEVTLRVPAAQRTLADTLRTALAHVLVNRDGVQLRPGTRSSARSWIRDGAMMSEALLRLGKSDAAIDFLKWYVPYQFEDGRVPCCVDARGSDPMPENDSHGEFIFLATEAVRYTADLKLAQELWPRVELAARYLDTLRAKQPGGLLAPAISHESYSAKPTDSHGDNFWGLIGYKSALSLAQILGRANEAAWLTLSQDKLRKDILAAIDESATNFIPATADLDDFDATSTAIALSPGDELARLPRARLLATFERFWTEFVARRDGKREWKEYTPNEWRNVAAFVRLGWRERAHEAIAFLMKDRRPAAWNQWAEVVGRVEREPRFIGDMPHGSVASDFIRSTLDLFAYERADDRALVLAAGVLPSWLEGEGTGIAGLRTPYGMLDYTLRRHGERVFVRVGETIRVPSGGLVIAWPLLDRVPLVPRRLAKSLEFREGELVVRVAPLDVELKLAR